MRFKKGTGFKETIEKEYPVYSASADIKKGALTLIGATPGTDNGCAILATSACADVLGIMMELYDYSVDGSSVVGSSEVLKTIAVNPLAVYEAEYDQTDTLAATDACANTALTLSSLEDNIDGAYLYAVSGTSIGQLVALTASAAGSCTLKAALDPAIAIADTFIKILPRFHRLVKLNSTAEKIGSDAAAGSGVARVLANYITGKNIVGKQELRPGTHSGKSGLDGNNVAFYADLLFLDHAWNPLS